jgi:putative endonuclease
VAERFKAQPWKGCVGFISTAGSNPALSAIFYIPFKGDKKWRDLARLTKLCLVGEAGPLQKDTVHLKTRHKMYNVYILLNRARTRTYTGVAAEVDERLKRHNDGHVPASRPYRPYEVIYVETYSTLKEARRKERFYKSTTGRRKLRELISRLSADANH